MELEALQERYEEIRRLGAELVAVSPQLPEKLRRAKSKHGLDFPLLADLGNAYAKQLSLVFTLPPEVQEIYRGFKLDLPQHNGDDSWQLPLPTRIVVDPQGVIQGIDADPDYTVRPEPEASLEIVQRLV